jgi:thiol-disulfide isomerase/thioredoxin
MAQPAHWKSEIVMPQPPALWLVLLLLATPVQALELAEGSNEPVPPLRFYDMQGNKGGLESFRGKVVVLNLWATWCAPCREEMPSLDRLAAQLDPKEAVVVALSVDRAGPERVRMFLDDIGVTRLLIFRDPWGLAARDLKVPGLPATILVDRAGREVNRLLGIAEWDSPEALAVVREIIGRP